MTEQRKRRLAAVWFADIVGYTDLSSRDENAALAVIDELQRIAREEVESRGGRIVKFVGDAVLTVFDSADAALRSALALRDGFTGSGVVQQHECALRIGVHLGEVVEAEDGDVYGDGVNVASRIEGQAEAGQVVVSEQVYLLLKQQADHGFNPFGPVKLKGVEGPMWLYVVGEVASQVAVSEALTPEAKSGRVYTAVTRHWPKITLGTMGAAVAAAFTLNDLEGVSFSSYVFAWAAATAGIWFLFDKAESAISARARKQVASYLRDTDLKSAIESIPDQFALLFDRIFGERHLSRFCLERSAASSVVASLIVFLVLLALGGGGGESRMPYVAGAVVVILGLGWAAEKTEKTKSWGRWTKGIVFLCAFVLGVFGAASIDIALENDGIAWAEGVLGAAIGLGTVTVLNLAPDYLSLLETRWAIGLLADKARWIRLLLFDFVLSWCIWLLLPLVALLILPDWVASTVPELVELGVGGVLFPPSFVSGVFGSAWQGDLNVALQVSFLSTFFTSVWLWLYAGSVLASRVLVRMNNGVGFLLRVTDVEKQPFRSMGFVSVIIVSALFALGLPFVLL